MILDDASIFQILEGKNELSKNQKLNLNIY